MPDRHKQHPIPFRPPDVDRVWLLSYAERTGQPVNRILAGLVARLRNEIALIDAHEAGHGTGTPGPGDRVAFPISKTVTGIGTVESIEGDGRAIIVRAGRRYRRPANDMVLSTATIPKRQEER